MIKTKLYNPMDNETTDQICWHNLTIADKYYDSQFFIAATKGWFEFNSGKNYQDLEKELREKKLNTHIIARPTNDNYECIISCKPYKYASEELLQYSNSYEENFKNLGKIINNQNIESNTNNDDYNFISNNLKKLDITLVSSESFLNELIEMCEKEYNTKPTEKIVGILPKGGPIFGLFINDNLVSNYGFVMGQILGNDTNNTMKIVDLKSLFQ